MASAYCWRCCCYCCCKLTHDQAFIQQSKWAGFHRITHHVGQPPRRDSLIECLVISECPVMRYDIQLTMLRVSTGSSLSARLSLAMWRAPSWFVDHSEHHVVRVVLLIVYLLTGISFSCVIYFLLLSGYASMSAASLFQQHIHRRPARHRLLHCTYSPHSRSRQSRSATTKSTSYVKHSRRLCLARLKKALS